MKIVTILFKLSFLLCNISFAQIEPSVTFDPETGNYIIRYQVEDEIVEVIYEPPTKVKPIIQANLELLNEFEFLYSYVVGNNQDAEQRIEAFTIEYYSNIDEITTPNVEWRYFPGRTPYLTWAHTLASPYGVRTPWTGIPPDSSADGFSFISSGLPSIVISYSEGNVRTLGLPYEPPMELDELLRPISDWPNATVQIKTIGPKNPPDPFLPLDFLDMLITYKDEAFELGWITHEGIKNSLNQKLYDARGELEVGNITPAGNILQAFINEVEALNRAGQHITGEAYALLKYNAEYLIERLE